MPTKPSTRSTPCTAGSRSRRTGAGRSSRISAASSPASSAIPAGMISSPRAAGGRRGTVGAVRVAGSARVVMRSLRWVARWVARWWPVGGPLAGGRHGGSCGGLVGRSAGQVQQAGAGLGERVQVHPGVVGAVLRHRAAGDAEVHRADHVGVLLGGLEQRAPGQPQGAVAVVGTRVEPHPVEHRGDLAAGAGPGRRLGRLGGLCRASGQVVAPLGAGGDGVTGRVGAVPVQGDGECGRQPGVLGHLVGAGGRAVEPGGPAAAGGGCCLAVGQVGVEELLELFSHGVDVQPGGLGELGQRPRAVLALEQAEQRRGRAGDAATGLGRRGGGRAQGNIFHVGKCRLL